jgi:hypothetical protein
MIDAVRRWDTGPLPIGEILSGLSNLASIMARR